MVPKKKKIIWYDSDWFIIREQAITHNLKSPNELQWWKSTKLYTLKKEKKKEIQNSGKKIQNHNSDFNFMSLRDVFVIL